MKKNIPDLFKEGLERQCTNCLKMFDKTKKDTMRICKECNTVRVKSNSIETKMLARAKQRARIRSIEFTLKKSDILIPKYCPILNIRLISHSGKSGAYSDSPSLDRINPNRGYNKDNIQVISQLANVMKNKATNEQLITFANWVIHNIPGHD